MHVRSDGRRRVRRNGRGSDGLALLAAVPDREPNVMSVIDAKLARALHDVADNEGASFLVLGSSHYVTRSALRGSVSTSVLRRAQCPVIVCPAGR